MGRPTRVAFFLPHFDAGGVERVVLNLLLHLDRGRFKPSLIVSRRQGTFLPQIPDDVPVFDLRGRHMRNAVPSLMSRLAKGGAEVVYSGTNEANLALLAASKLLSRRPAVVASEHTSPTLYLREAKWRPFRLAAMRFLYPGAKCIAVPLAEIGDELRRALRLPNLPVVVLPNPVLDTTALRTDEFGPPALWPEAGGPVFVSAGRLDPEKGFDILLEAFARLDGDLSESHLVILGEGPERGRLEAMVRSRRLAERVHWPGFVSNPLDFFRRADAFVLASRREGCPNVLVEALAVGTPVIATDCPVGPRAVLENGACGILVSPEDPDALAEAIRRLMRDPDLASKLRERGRKRASDFDIERNVPCFEELFSEVVSK